MIHKLIQGKKKFNYHFGLYLECRKWQQIHVNNHQFVIL